MQRFLAATIAFACLIAVPAYAFPVGEPSAGTPYEGAAPSFRVYAGSSLITEARRYEGMTARQIGLSRRTLWCGAFLAHVAKRAGKPVPKYPDLARNWAKVGRPSPGRIGDIAVLERGKRGGHVGVVTGVDARGNPILISGNHRNRVGEAAYPRGRVIAFRSV